MNAHPMNPSSHSSTPPKDLFFRLADRLQIEACLEAIEQDGKSVILHSISPGLLDHYSQILVQRLRRRLPDTPTEIFFPTHTEALIARFNDLLEDVSVDAATQSQEPQAPRKLWVVHDASALPDHELKLLLRLLQHLPGARVSAVLVLNGQASSLRNLDPQGRRLMRWEIEPPTQAQIDQMVEEARQMGREFAALELIARLQPETPSAVSPAPATTAVSAPVLQAEPAAESPPSAGRLQRRSTSRVMALLMGLVLLAASAGVAVWLNPQALRALNGNGAALASAPEASSPVSETEPAPAPPAEPQASAPEDLASNAQAANTTPVPSTLPAASASAPTASDPKLIQELPEVAQNGLSWLRKLEADTWVIEHSRHPTAQAARKQMASDPLLANARIIPVMQPGSEMAEFLVTTGPFRSIERARNYISRHGLGRSAALHETATLKTLTPAQAMGTRRR